VDPLDFKFLKDRYDYELQRKEQLTSALSLPVGLLGGLGSLLAVIVRSFSPARDLVTLLFFLSVIASGVAFFACLVTLARAYHRQTYRYLPLLRSLDDKLGEWRSFYQDVGHDGAEQAFFEHDLRSHVIDAADRNTQNNDTRSALLYWARVWLFVLLGGVAVVGVLYIAHQVNWNAPF
jgi:hypothetical protein